MPTGCRIAETHAACRRVLRKKARRANLYEGKDGDSLPTARMPYFQAKLAGG
mgnify:CR=1 FL=1